MNASDILSNGKTKHEGVFKSLELAINGRNTNVNLNVNATGIDNMPDREYMRTNMRYDANGNIIEYNGVDNTKVTAHMMARAFEVLGKENPNLKVDQLKVELVISNTHSHITEWSAK